MSTADFLSYLPYVLGIGAFLAWYWWGLARETWREFRQLYRRRNLSVLDASGMRRRPSVLRFYLGELGPCSRSSRQRGLVRTTELAASGAARDG